MIRWRHRLVRRLFLIVAGPMFGLRIEGTDRLPAEGPAILVANHRSWLDPPVLGAASPRPVSFLIFEGVYDRPWMRWFYRFMGTIPVSADSRMSLRAMREAMRRLREGELIGIFPEGRVYTREQPGELRPGVALLALRSGAPVVPLHIRGSDDAWPKGRSLPRPAPVSVTVDAPIETGNRGLTTPEELMRRIKESLSESR